MVANNKMKLVIASFVTVICVITVYPLLSLVDIIQKRLFSLISSYSVSVAELVAVDQCAIHRLALMLHLLSSRNLNLPMVL